MAKFYGKIGYAESQETAPGVWTDAIVTKIHKGDILKNTRRIQPSEHLSDNISVNNIISIISDPYAETHMFNMKYAAWKGVNWVVTNVEVNYPRLLLTLGGVYNGPTDETTTIV